MADKVPKTAEDVARWMADRVTREGFLGQRDAVAEIEDRFGDEFVYINDRGNPAITPNVLAAFRKLTEKSTVWDRPGRHWRPREPDDSPSREQR